MSWAPSPAPQLEHSLSPGCGCPGCVGQGPGPAEASWFRLPPALLPAQEGDSEEVIHWDGVSGPAYPTEGLFIVCLFPRMLQLYWVLLQLCWAVPFQNGMEPGLP